MKRELKPIAETAFSSLYHSLVYIRCPDYLETVKDLYTISEKDDGVLAVCYVDAMAGMSFRVITVAHFDKNKLKLSNESKETMMILRSDEEFLKKECSVISTEEVDYSNYKEYIEIAEAYDEGYEEVVKTRFISILDPFRYPGCPDDVQIYFVGEKIQPENMWLKLTRADDKCIYGKLMDEPFQKEIGFHNGDEVDFGFMQQKDGSLVAIHVCK